MLCPEMLRDRRRSVNHVEGLLGKLSHLRNTIFPKFTSVKLLNVYIQKLTDSTVNERLFITLDRIVPLSSLCQWKVRSTARAGAYVRRSFSVIGQL